MAALFYCNKFSYSALRYHILTLKQDKSTSDTLMIAKLECYIALGIFVLF